MKTITPAHLEALQLIKDAIEFGANIWSHPKGARGGNQ